MQSLDQTVYDKFEKLLAMPLNDKEDKQLAKEMVPVLLEILDSSIVAMGRQLQELLTMRDSLIKHGEKALLEAVDDSPDDAEVQ